jgi:hypothetical protein
MNDHGRVSVASVLSLSLVGSGVEPGASARGPGPDTLLGPEKSGPVAPQRTRRVGLSPAPFAARRSAGVVVSVGTDLQNWIVDASIFAAEVTISAAISSASRY